MSNHIEITRVFDGQHKLVGYSERRVCWAGDKAGHRCKRDADHSGAHQDDCFNHGTVTFDGGDSEVSD